MAMQFPPKPWYDGDTFTEVFDDGTSLTGQYDADKNFRLFI